MKKAKFIIFEKVRKSGLTNMFDINEVRLISAKYGPVLSKEDCFDIMLNYDKYALKYLAKLKWNQRK